MFHIIANWKANLDRTQALNWLVEFKKSKPDLGQTRIGIAPSFTETSLIGEFLNNWNLCDQIDLTAQNVSRFDMGAYTGEITARHLHQLGVKLAIVGHSERRTNFHETDTDIAAKLKLLHQYQIRPIVAVSEIAQVEFLAQEKVIGDQTIFAYEPVESIGTGNPADPDQVRDFVNRLLQILPAHNIKILYGGSVDAQTVAPYLELEKISGFLVGGASNKAGTFLELLKAIRSG